LTQNQAVRRVDFPVIILGSLLLLWPAFANGWPLVFHDTGGYLDRGYLLTLGFGRSLYYGLFLRATSWTPLVLWPAIFLQAAINAWVIALCLQILGAGRNYILMALAAIAFLTGQAFFTAQLMPDAFTAPMVLAIYLLAFHLQALSRAEKILLSLLVTFSCLVHMSHLAVCAGLVLVLFFLRLAYSRLQFGVPWAGLLAALMILPMGNFLVSGTIGFTPGGSVFVLGRLVQDGLVQQVLDDLCPDPRFKLCAYKDVLPSTANDFVWGGEDAPLRQIGGLEGADDEAKALIAESLRRHPLDNLYFAARALVDQFLLFKTGDELGAFLWHTRWRIEVYFPDQLAAFDAALQQQKGKIDFNRIDPFHTGIIVAAALAILAMAWRGPAESRQFALFMLLALIGNAAVCGIFSNPQPRYQDRLIWVVLLGAFMAYQRRRNPKT